jgi:hypothetical protein
MDFLGLRATLWTIRRADHLAFPGATYDAQRGPYRHRWPLPISYPKPYSPLFMLQKPFINLVSSINRC